MTTHVTDIMTERPLRLPEVDCEGRTPLRQWRESEGWSGVTAAEFFGVSAATYYRYEAGLQLNIRKANEIVHLTDGAIRYRDLIADFIPEYA